MKCKEIFIIYIHYLLPHYLCFVEYSSVCEMPVTTGPCKASITRWYYDKEVEACKPFMWGGCDGNGNNFQTKTHCSDTCSNDNFLGINHRIESGTC